ncbi:MAG: hypothetical protein NC118_10935 [Eubacterium sp.]|nr:hypothetical protein [Eubacterium sp.]
MINNIICNEYQHNAKFRRYVDRYCKAKGLTVEEALAHEIVRQAYLYYTEV